MWRGWDRRTWVACGLLALMAKLALALTTIGTNDVTTWRRFADSIDAYGALWLYHADSTFNHPPFLAHALPVVNWLARHTALGFPFWLRLPAILADFGSLVLVAVIVRPRPRLLVLLAICPVSILISGFHGNTDPVMIFLVLLSIYFLDRRNWLIAAAVALGIAVSIKIPAIVAAPALVFYLESNRRRILFALAAGATFALLAAPYVFQDPAVIVRNVLGYRSLEGIWGFPRLARALELAAHHVGYVKIVAGIGRPVSLLLITVLMAILSRRPVSLYGRCAISMFVFVWVIPGFSVQYLAWLVPFALFFGEASAAAVYASSSVFLFLVYNYWARRFPWYYANSFATGGWPHRLVPFDLLAWTIIGLVLFVYARRTRKSGCFEQAPDREIGACAI